MSEKINRNIYFRKNLFGGFNKNDVIAFLAEQSRDQISEKDTSKRELAALKAEGQASAGEADKLRGELASMAETLSAKYGEEKLLKSNLEAETARRRQAEEKLSRLQDELKNAADEFGDGARPPSSNAQVEELLSKIDTLSVRNAELSAAVARLTRFKESVAGLIGGADITAEEQL